MKNAVAIACVLAACGSAMAQSVDGFLDASYGSALSVQNTQTQFGDSNLGQNRFANGSELDAGYARIANGNLYLFLAGNLESNFNKIEIFIETGAGGQNVLRGDNADVDFNGLNRMAGLRLPTGFNASRYLTASGGNSPYAMFVNAADLLPGGGGSGGYLGSNDGSGAALAGGNNPFGIMAAIDNSNTAGVSGGNGIDNSGAGAFVETGMEFAIPLAALGDNLSTLRIVAFINGGGHDFMSNQVLGGIGGGNNIGEPQRADLSNVTPMTIDVPTPGAAALMGLAGLVGLRRRR